MGWTSETATTIFKRRLVPLFFDLELLVHRVGYLRVLAGAVTVLSVVGVLGTVLGVTWLRIAFASLLGLLFLVSSGVAFSATRSLRERVARSERLVHLYAESTTPSSPFTISSWEEFVEVRSNGDALIRRELTLSGAEDNRGGGPPHFLSVSLVYYGTSRLSERAKRRVVAKAFHSNAKSTTDGVRALGTSAWSTTRTGRPRLDIYVHLGHSVRAGDTITVTWDWPGYSAGLMSGRESENFDVLFRQTVGHVTYRAVFHGIAEDARFALRSHCQLPNLKRERHGSATTVTFELDEPEYGRKYGFTADYQKND